MSVVAKGRAYMDDLADFPVPLLLPPAAQSSPPPQRKRSNVSSDHVKNKAERFCWMAGVLKFRVILMGIG